MIVSAMIFAGLTLVIGGVLGFLLGQARGRMMGEERLRDAEVARATLERQAAELREALGRTSSNRISETQPGAAEQAGR